MKKFLLPENGKYYKVNMHCHSTVSDGKYSPAELKKQYMEKGYSAIAFTDHDVFFEHDELTDEHFVALHGYEIGLGFDTPESLVFPGVIVEKCCHLNFVALNKDDMTPVCLHRTKYLPVMGKNSALNTPKMQFGDMEDYIKVYTPEGVNDMIAKARAKGFFVTYNHPIWSLENYPTYSKYTGMNALEIFNYANTCAGYDDRNDHEYDELLRLGNRIGCVGGDDNHNHRSTDDPLYDSFGAWTMICAERLDYDGLAQGLKNGDYYASMGPEITNLWVEDGVMHAECAPARSIFFSTGIRHAKQVGGDKTKDVTCGEFRIEPSDQYVRVTVVGRDGSKAHSRAYFIDELLGK